MKKFITIFIILFFHLAIAQVSSDSIIPAQQQLHDNYIKKRNTNNTTGWLMLGSGIAMIVGGVAKNISEGILDNNAANNSKGLWISYIGGATTLASIPFFISAGENKRKANLALKTNIITLYNETLYDTNHFAVVLKVEL